MIRPTAPLAALIAALTALPPAPLAASGAFVAGIGDLPLMGGLVPLADQSLVFDNPGGRIVQAVARGPVEAGAVRTFYAAALPQLGWRTAGPDRWSRDGELLALEFPESGLFRGTVPLTVRFLLSPH